MTRGWNRILLAASVGALAAAAWFLLWAFGAALHAPIHHHPGTTIRAYLWLFVGGWTVMTMAMMLPTSLPLIMTFHTIAGERRDRPQLVTLVIVGYLSIWTLAGVLAYGADAVARQAVVSSAWLETRAYVGGALVLLLAGAYQFTPLKYRCLEKCRSPLSFVLGYWQGDRNHWLAFRLGVDHGLFCVGCCWALMLLMLGVGIANLAWMLVLGAVMAVEKNMPWGRQLSAPLGIVLLTSGVVVLALA